MTPPSLPSSFQAKTVHSPEGADIFVRWSYISPVGVNPGANGILRALENLGKETTS